MAHHSGPLLGYNNNVPYRGEVYHVQTEDSGSKRPHVITHLFADGGRIVKTQKTSYAHFVGSENLTERVRALMREQHKGMVISLRDGHLDHLISGEAPAAAAAEAADAAQSPEIPASAPIELVEQAPQADDPQFHQEMEQLAPSTPHPATAEAAAAQPSSAAPPPADGAAAALPPVAQAAAEAPHPGPPAPLQPLRPSGPPAAEMPSAGTYSFVGGPATSPRRRSVPPGQGSAPRSQPPASGRMRSSQKPPASGSSPAYAPPSEDHTGKPSGRRSRRAISGGRDSGRGARQVRRTDAGQPTEPVLPKPPQAGSHRFGERFTTARRFDELVVDFLDNPGR